MCLAFSAVWLGVKGSALASPQRADLIIVYVIAVLNVGTRTLIAYRSPKGTSGQLGWAFTGVDIVLIAVAVNLTGRLSSDLWLIFFFLVVTETLSVSVKAEMMLDIIVALGYTAAVWPVADWMTYTTRLVFLFLTGAVARRMHSNAEIRNTQLSQLREVLEVEKEKSRLAREIHDGVGREIVNVILGLEVAARTADKSTPPAEAVSGIVRENIAILRSAMDSTRQLIFETRPWTLDESAGKLSDRIEEYARRFADRTGVIVDVDVDAAIDELPQSTSFAILRIMQESLNNAAKHAQASTIHIRAICVDKEMRLTIVDDGVGFDLGARGGDGIGLKAMRERAGALRGRVDIDSSVGQGTTISLTVPTG